MCSKMKYSVDSVPHSGTRFKLEEGTIDELYSHIVSVLQTHYTNQNLELVSPARPHFGQMDFGQTKLRSHNVQRTQNGNVTSHGHDNLIYFKGGSLGKVKHNADYATSPVYGRTNDQITCETLTVYFDTWLPKIEKDDLKWARDTERDVVLEKMLSGEYP